MINAYCLLHQVFLNIKKQKCPINPLHATWEDYEKEKRKLLILHLSATDYQNAIRQKVEEFNL